MLSLGLGFNLSQLAGARSADSGNPTPPAGFAFVVKNGSYITKNGAYLIKAA